MFWINIANWVLTFLCETLSCIDVSCRWFDDNIVACDNVVASVNVVAEVYVVIIRHWRLHLRRFGKGCVTQTNHFGSDVDVLKSDLTYIFNFQSFAILFFVPTCTKQIPIYWVLIFNWLGKFRNDELWNRIFTTNFRFLGYLASTIRKLIIEKPHQKVPFVT